MLFRQRYDAKAVGILRKLGMQHVASDGGRDDRLETGQAAGQAMMESR